MIQGALLKDIQYGQDKVQVTLLMETSSTKELRIVFKSGQMMKDHQSPYPIVVEVFEGNIIFGVGENEFQMKRGDLIALEANVMHNLKAECDSIVRLTLSKSDTLERVKQV